VKKKPLFLFFKSKKMKRKSQIKQKSIPEQRSQRTKLALEKCNHVKKFNIPTQTNYKTLIQFAKLKDFPKLMEYAESFFSKNLWRLRRFMIQSNYFTRNPDYLVQLCENLTEKEKKLQFAQELGISELLLTCTESDFCIFTNNKSIIQDYF